MVYLVLNLLKIPKKILKKKVETDWAYIFHVISKEYGHTSEQILQLTEREICWRLEQIFKDKDESLAVEAKLHGLEYKPKKTVQTAELSAEQKQKLDAVLKQTQQRIRAKHGHKN